MSSNESYSFNRMCRCTLQLMWLLSGVDRLEQLPPLVLHAAGRGLYCWSNRGNWVVWERSEMSAFLCQ